MATTSYKHESIGDEAVAFVADGEVILNTGVLDQLHTIEHLDAVCEVMREIKRDLVGAGGVRRAKVTREEIEEPEAVAA